MEPVDGWLNQRVPLMRHVPLAIPSLPEQAFVSLIESVGASEGMEAREKQKAVDRVRSSVSHTYVDTFDAAHDDNCRRKLGLAAWDAEADDLFRGCFTLMASKAGPSGMDFTLFWRALSRPPPSGAASEADTETDAGADAAAIHEVLEAAALSEVSSWPDEHRSAWLEWATRYWRRVAEEEAAGKLTAEQRVELMQRANPKYILRNWMAAEAYEAAERGDDSVVREMHAVLSRPYDEQGARADAWAQVTPHWARDRAGFAYMS